MVINNQDNNQNRYNEELEAQERLNEIENLVKSKMTKDAILRYGNIKLAYPQKALQFLAIAVQYLQNGIKLIDDNLMKDILRKMNKQ